MVVSQYGALKGVLASLATFPESETPLELESAIMDALVPMVTAGENVLGLGEWLKPVVATGEVVVMVCEDMSSPAFLPAQPF